MSEHHKDLSLIKDRISALTDAIELGLPLDEKVRSLLELADLHRQIQNNREALDLLTQAIEEMNGARISGRPLYDAHLAASRLLAIRASASNLARSLEHGEWAIAVASNSELPPDDLFQAMLNRASLLNYMDRMDESEAAYREVLKALPAESTGGREFRHIIYSNLGILSGKRGNLDKAETMLDQAIEVAPDSDPIRKASIIKSKARLHFMRQEYDVARALLEKAKDVALGEGTDHHLISIILFDLEEVCKAQNDHKGAYENLVERMGHEKKWNDRQVEFQMVATQVRHDLLDAKRQKEIFRLENVELVRLNNEISEQKAHIEHINTEIIDSINYASRLQKAFIPGSVRLKAEMPKAFTIEMPKDRVSGDFCWSHLKDGLLYVAVADCTGHGVPGAMITVLGNQLLTDSIEMDGLRAPAAILSRVCDRIREILTRSGNEHTKDGMDTGLLLLDRANGTWEYCGAKRPLWIWNGTELLEIKTGRMSVGTDTPPDHVFESERGQILPGLRFFLHSDGYTDQFGGPLNKKFQAQRLRDIILEHKDSDMPTNGEAMHRAIVNWKEGYEQTDDITLIGIET
jgi:serine phosphatase RsbU (regulator of sigma subunit)